VRNNCLSGECTASCRGDEVLVSAYCGPSHNQATFLDERQASCGIEVTSANAPLGRGLRAGAAMTSVIGQFGMECEGEE
jgi:hypothetical protein